MSGDSGINNEQNNIVRDELLEAGNTAGTPGVEQCGVYSGEPQGFLEIVYGVLFEPVKTMKKAAENPPLVTALAIVTILSLLGTLMVLLNFSRVLSQSLDAGGILPGARALVPVGAFIGLVFSYIKWFGYSAVLHLAADLLGGRGGARGVFAAAGLAVEVWSSILLVIGIREVHLLSTGRAVLVFFIPFMALFLLLILSVLALAVTISVFPINTNIPGYF